MVSPGLKLIANLAENNSMQFSRNLENRTNEYGFRLPEVSVTIAVLSILMAIVVPTWQNVVNSRSVDSAANQLASDLRLVSSKSANQLKDWTVTFDSAASYQLTADGTSHLPYPARQY